MIPPEYDDVYNGGYAWGLTGATTDDFDYPEEEDRFLRYWFNTGLIDGYKEYTKGLHND